MAFTLGQFEKIGLGGRRPGAHWGGDLKTPGRAKYFNLGGPSAGVSTVLRLEWGPADIWRGALN